MLKAIDRDRYDVIPVGITRAGAFVLEVDDADHFRLDPAHLPEVVDNGTRVLWPEVGGAHTLRVRRANGEIDELGAVDVVLPILHGVHGEDGTVQGFFDTLGIPYAGGGVLDSALCMDKHFMKIVLQAAGIPVAPWVTVRAGEVDASPATRAAIDALGLPLFVKPARAGSSVGVSKVAAIDELAEALAVAFAEDDKVLIESAMVGREIEIAILDGRAGASPRASLPGEVVLQGREFYDFEGKYLGGDGVSIVCPADVSADELAQMQALGVRAFEAVGGRGLARVDFFLTADGGFVVNELNTMPGFTPISMFPKCWIASGMSYADLITELVELGLETQR